MRDSPESRLGEPELFRVEILRNRVDRDIGLPSDCVDGRSVSNRGHVVYMKHEYIYEYPSHHVWVQDRERPR